MLGFFFRHYDGLVQRYVVFDDGSTDNSLDLLRSNPKVDLRPMPPYSDPESRVASALSLLESCWKESRGIADWVIVTDIDEHLYHPDLNRYLTSCRDQGVTIVPALGYEMLSDDFPQDDTLLCHSLTKGAPSHQWSKLSLFSPSGIDATDFEPGRHAAAPKGNVIAPARDEVLLLHYKYLDFDRVRRRHERFLTRQRKKDFEMEWGHQYSWSRERLLEVWNQVAGQLVDISRPDLRPWETHEGPRWWDCYQRAQSAPR